MKPCSLMICVGCALGLLPVLLPAQMERLSRRQRLEILRPLAEWTDTVRNPFLREHLAGIADARPTPEDRSALNAVRVARDATNSAVQSPFVHYAVPAMSEYQRLPDLYPLDGEANAPVRIVVARDEYEPGAFTLYPLVDLGKVELTLTPFLNENDQKFPPEQLDLKLLKVWYQNKNAWYSYFGDTKFKQVAELLLNDEDLIRVDESRKANYARLTAPDGSVTNRWINPPREFNERYSFHYRKTHVFAPMRPGFDDAETLRPVTL